MYELDKVKEYIDKKFSGRYDGERVEFLYNKISNPQLRVNTDDKLWVAYGTQASEKKTVAEAIKGILSITTTAWISGKKERVEKEIDEVGKLFESCGIKDKPRIPFYILVLNGLCP